jgi:hypothetical protein
MTRRTIGLLAGVVSSAVGAWYWLRRQTRQSETLPPARSRGTVIFDNTPRASEGEQAPLA